jgi:type IV pilus assembly protein PilA
MMKVSRGNKGFTLIELLIVVAIIGILAAIAIPAYTGYTKKAKVAGIVHNMGAIKNSVVAYYTETGGQANGDVFAAAVADVAAIKTALGVDISTQYALYDISVAGVITGTPIATLGIGGNLVLTPQNAFKDWNWNASTCDVSYRPK